MDEKIITLIGKKQAKIGYKFTFLKTPNEECRNCKLYTTCIANLKEGQSYEIIEVRKKVHDCPVHEDGVQIVEVKELPLIALIDSKMGFSGAIITFRSPNCEEYSCKLYEKCNTLLKNNQKYKILEILGDQDCKLGNKLKLAKLKCVSKSV
ncbi:MAG: UPF0179 family protein [Candidatus Helarchaeota archaeon]